MIQFRSIKTRLALLIAGVLFAVSASFMFFTSIEVEKGMTESEEQSARNVLRLVLLNIESSYRALANYREQSLEKHKKELRNVTAVVEAYVENGMKEAGNGSVSADSARAKVLREIGTIRYGANDYVFVLGRNSVILSHPDPSMIGADMSKTKDATGNLFVPGMVRTALENPGGGYTRYLWRRLGEQETAEKLSYSKFLPEWQWIIGTGLYIDEIEKESRKKMEEMISNLRETFAKIKIAETGYVFIFDGKKKLIIHPSHADSDLSGVKNPSTGNLIIDDLMAAAKTPDRPIEYMWDKPGQKGRYIFPKESYVSYFKPLDWYICSTIYRDEIKKPSRIIVTRQLYIISVIVLLALLIGSIVINRISGPIEKLTAYAKELPSSDFSMVPDKESAITRLAENYGDEVGRLAGAFVFMERSLKDYISRLTETTAVKERIESELNIAHDIQMSILPKIFPAFPEKSEFDIYAVIEPAKEVGGDFYDFFYTDDTHLCFVIADVSGKGVPASLFMAVTKTLIKATAREGITPDEIMMKVNNELSRDNDVSMFVTIFCGILDTVTGEMVYANAGHNPPILLKKEGAAENLKHLGDLVIGAFAGITYRKERMKLAPGDSLFLYTDGVTEAMNEREEFFTERRLMGELNSLKGKSIQDTISGVMEKVVLFSSSVPQSDDITMMMLKYNGTETS